ncbi:primosomal protein [Nakamurella sp. PAMC28650]|uniref:primosomal protein n=1 Tax=Nakamurella sp. PAMC28650 TaxID=2762325 RepID=UPI00164ED726|nr:primosomal protein [Nakamurella sp. PAMC28650]QNK83089.1 primosomal protein [Nakamurella sp. PAMC28650]
MAAEIIPIQLGLTAGNGLTLWAPRWREDGEEWEAFLGHGDDLYVFPTPAHLAAFIRGTDEHDLTDHPEWEAVSEAMTDELMPDDDHRFDIVGVPELVAETPDIWTLAELADTVAILHSLADVCDLPVIDDVLADADGFAVLSMGETAFAGRRGEKLWDGIGAVVSKRWDEVIEALDGLVKTPEVDASTLEAAEAEAVAVNAVVVQDPDEDEVAELEEGERDPELEFWDEIGIDCVEITVAGRSGWTMRCYLEDQPVFLSKANRIQIFSSDEKLENYLTDAGADHKLASLAVWPEIREAIDGGDAVVVAGPENTYELDGLGDNLMTGPGSVDRRQLELAVELLTDAAVARKDEETSDALSSATPLSSLISAIVKPDADRMPPAPPFDDEVAAWNILVDRFASTLEWDGESEV